MDDPNYRGSSEEESENDHENKWNIKPENEKKIMERNYIRKVYICS